MPEAQRLAKSCTWDQPALPTRSASASGNSSPDAAEFFFLLDGTVRNQGQAMTKGDGYVAAAGSVHTDFATDTGANYIVIFKL